MGREIYIMEKTILCDAVCDRPNKKQAKPRYGTYLETTQRLLPSNDTRRLADDFAISHYIYKYSKLFRDTTYARQSKLQRLFIIMRSLLYHLLLLSMPIYDQAGSQCSASIGVSA